MWIPSTLFLVVLVVAAVRRVRRRRDVARLKDVQIRPARGRVNYYREGVFLLLLAAGIITEGAIAWLVVDGTQPVAASVLAAPEAGARKFATRSDLKEQRQPVEAQPETTLDSQPSALIIPPGGLIWNQSSSGVYLWAKPGSGILVSLPNGSRVIFLDSWAGYGGLPWAQVRYEELEGWVEATDVYRVAAPEEWRTQVAGAAGAFLYERPGGAQISWLPEGTPVFVLGEDGEGWLTVRLLDGSEGWVKIDALLLDVAWYP